MALWTQSDCDALQVAALSGVLTVTYDGPPRRSVTFRTLDEIWSVLAVAQQSVNAQAGKSSYVLAGTRKGL